MKLLAKVHTLQLKLNRMINIKVDKLNEHDLNDFKELLNQTHQQALLENNELAINLIEILQRGFSKLMYKFHEF